MGNAKNKKVPKKRKASNNSQRTRSSDQKENVPKIQKTKTIKPNPDDGIAMSKQLLLKKTNGRTQRRSSSKPVRICPNGKPLPSLSELDKMYEDSDDDDQSSKTSTQKPICTTPTPEQQIPKSISENNMLSPSKINEISERLLGSIEKQNLPDPSELLEATSLLCGESPPAPIIPPKKRKKPEVPYIVGCKDRPKVIRKPNTNFCKGDDDYGVEASGDPEEETPRKRAKKSRIPKYTKSIFNAHSDVIAERLAREDAGGLSDASSDSNKTIEYEPTLFQSSRLHSFSPLPSTSTDTETFKKNDELFNDSLKEMNISKESSPKNTDDLLIIGESVTEIKENDISITKQSTPTKKDNVLITKETTSDKKCGELIREHSISNIKEDKVLIKEESTLIDDEVQIIDSSYDTIEIEDSYYRPERMRSMPSKAVDTDTIEIIEPVESEVVKQSGNNKIIHKVPDDEDCMIVTSPETINNLNNLNEPIVIDDEYSTINLEFDSFHDSLTEETEIIDVDDIIAENKSILDKWNNNGAKDLNRINTVVEVSTDRTTHRDLNTLQTTSTPAMPSTAMQTTSLTAMPRTAVQTTSTPTITSTAVQTTSSPTIPNTTLQSGCSNSVVSLSTTTANNHQIMTNRNSATNYRGRHRPPTSNCQSMLHVVDDFFSSLQFTPVGGPRSGDVGTGLSSIIDSIINQFQKHRSTSNTNRVPKQTTNTSMPAGQNSMRTMHNADNSLQNTNNSIQNANNSLQNADNRQRDLVGLSNLSSHSGTQQTSMTNNGDRIPSSTPVARNIGDCPICLDSLNSSNGIASTICGHVFCLNCIKASVKTNGKKCPTCRKALKGPGGGYHQLYL